ncbi:MAG: YggT family protein [Gammaproteobacteria bacterium]|jgi:YggT family protein|nr:YggT family protein [Gammaproteobacteria bacterium]
MNAGYLANPLEFLVSTLFSLYILAVMLRFLLGAVRADFYNPVSQFLVRITNPLLVPMRKVIPSLGKFDTSALLLMLLLQMISLSIVFMLRGISISVVALLVTAVAELLLLLINIFMFSIIIQVILSWINPGSYNPVTAMLYSITSPIMRPIQRLVPPISGIDLSPLVAIIGLQVVRMLILPLLG